MKLQEVFEQLTVGEFSQLAIGGGAVGEISEDDQIKVVPHINLALSDLYKRFTLKEGREVIPLVSGTYLYTPEAKDLLKIERVLTADGDDLNLNDESDPLALATPTLKTLRVPKDIVEQSTSLDDWLKTDSVEVVYRADHPRILTSGFTYLPNVELELPYSHLYALLLFVASRVHNPVGMTNEFHMGNNYYAKYMAACADLELQNLEIDQVGTNQRLRRGGWV